MPPNSPRWIPVTEALPRHGDVVLVGREVPSDRLRLAQYIAPPCRYQWKSVPGTWEISHITHWCVIEGPK